MAISLGSNIASLRGQRQLGRTSHELRAVFERLSSGQRINRASDDAAGLAIADALNAHSRVFNQGVRNLNDGLSLLAIADSALEQLSGIVIRLQELAEQAANGIYSGRQRSALNKEAQALSDEYTRILQSTEFNGRKLFSADFGELRLQAGYGVRGSLAQRFGETIGTGTFGSALTTGFSGTLLRAAAVADFNGDGNSDVVTVDFTNDRAYFLLGNGSGTLSVSATINIGDGPQVVIAADVNNDGAMDIVSADSLGNTVTVVLGTGSGTFGPAVSYDVGPAPPSVNLGDFNEDGNLDLLTGNSTDSSLSLLLGTGAGTFGSAQTISVTAGPQQTAIADLNGDGHLDIAVAQSGVDGVAVRLGLGDGSFAAMTTYSTGIGSNPVAVVAGDFNGDGIFDLAAANRYTNSVGILLGSGGGSFGSITTYAVGVQPRSIAVADFNNDGIPDLVTGDGAGDSISVLIGSGGGSFSSATSYVAGDDPRGIAIGDFTNDGVTDIITANSGSGGSLTVFLAETTVGFAALSDFSLLTQDEAAEALEIFGQRLQKLGQQRGELGAFQSRTAVAVNVLLVSSENFRAAESRIRDADIADESSRLVRLNILQQAAASVLAQANQQPALTLQLLQA